LRGALGRRFGGIGAAVPNPSLLIEAVRAPSLTADGPSPAANRAVQFGRRFLAHHNIESGAHVRIHSAIPAHSGLGSGTQLALAVARALAELYELPTDVDHLARVTGRAQRSAIGTWLFAQGGFVLEGGRRPGSKNPAPQLARFTMPATWRCVVAVPSGNAGMSGAAARAQRDARLAPRAHGALARAGRRRSPHVRPRPDGDPVHQRPMVRPGAGRGILARRERGAH